MTIDHYQYTNTDYSNDDDDDEADISNAVDISIDRASQQLARSR